MSLITQLQEELGETKKSRWSIQKDRHSVGQVQRAAATGGREGEHQGLRKFREVGDGELDAAAASTRGTRSPEDRGSS